MAVSSPGNSSLQLSSGSYVLLPLIPRCPLGLVCEGMEMPHLGLSIRLYWEVTPRATDDVHTSLGQLFSFEKLL